MWPKVQSSVKKKTTSVFGQKKVSHLEVTISGQSKDGSNYLQSFVVKAEGIPCDYSFFSKVRLATTIKLWRDKGYQGIGKLLANSQIPTKKPKSSNLSKVRRQENRTLASQRIVIEHVNRKLKIVRILSERYRNRRRRFGLCFNLIAGIYNYELNLS
ncbi:transposase family protein [Microcoleus sp. K5-D4]|uniref:transposase family protein n=1 Tax=Microcoleus sp. K5-D4 TaxID=2818801 RepID=UPI002FD55CA5